MLILISLCVIYAVTGAALIAGYAEIRDILSR